VGVGARRQDQPSGGAHHGFGRPDVLPERLLPVGRDPAPGDERRQDVTFQRHDTRADRLHHPGREHIGSAVDLVRRRVRALLEERRHPTPGVGDDTPERPGIVHGADVEHRVEPVVGQRQLAAQVMTGEQVAVDDDDPVRDITAGRHGEPQSATGAERSWFGGVLEANAPP